MVWMCLKSAAAGGALSAHLAEEHGAIVKGITLSSEQLEAAEARLATAGLTTQVQLRLEDYRETTGQFDRIASIEMIEAVGEAWWPVYFRRIADLLKPGGHAVIQAITIDAARFEGYRSSPDFIQRYIFPGGMLPTTGIIAAEAEAAGLVPRIEKSFGPDYARTLCEWRRRFHDAWPKIVNLGYPAHFPRTLGLLPRLLSGGFRDPADGCSPHHPEKTRVTMHAPDATDARHRMGRG